jgi:hypothetical protein
MKKSFIGHRLPITATGIVAAALGASLLPSSVSAALSVYEPFSYTAAANLNTQNGGTGFSGAWSGATTATINASGLSYSTVPALGLAASTAAGTAVANSRSVSATLGGNGTTTYFSFLMRPDNVNTARNAEFGLIGSANLWVGKSFSGTDNTHFVLESGTAGSGTGLQATTTTATSGTTVLLVLRADFAAGNDTFKLYVNPTSVLEPGSAAATLTGIDVGTSLTSLQINGNLGFTFDELKIGSSYADVVPEPSTYAAAFAVAGIVSIAWLRRRSDTKRA